MHVAGEILVDIEFACFHLLEKRRVLFVNDFVGRKMFAAKVEGVFERRLPDVHGLTGNGEHEIDIQILETSLAKNIERFEDLLSRMDASEPFEKFFVERLNTHGDAIDAVVAEEFGFVFGNGGGIALDGPFRRVCEAEAFHRPKKFSPLAKIENGWGTAPKEDGARWFGTDHFEFRNQRADIPINESLAGSVRIKSAVFAFMRAEGDMDVDAVHLNGQRDSAGTEERYSRISRFIRSISARNPETDKR